MSEAASSSIDAHPLPSLRRPSQTQSLHSLIASRQHHVPAPHTHTHTAPMPILFEPTPSMQSTTLMKLHQQMRAAAEHAARVQAAAAEVERELEAARMATNTGGCTCEASESLAPGARPVPCICAASGAASSTEAHSAASSTAAAVSPARSTPLDALSRSIGWAKSVSRLRSSLISAYACWKYVTSGSGGASEATTSLEFVTPTSAQLASATGGSMLQNASNLTRTSATSIPALAQRAWSQPTRQSTLQLLRHLYRAILFFATTYSRRVHRFIRPHLLLLIRSRALSKLGGMVFPFLRRNLLLASHVAFVWGSILILIRRYVPAAHIRWGRSPIHVKQDPVAAEADESMWSSFASTIRSTFAELHSSVLGRWSSLRLPHKLLAVLSLLTLLFLAVTCVQIVREYRRRREQRMRLLLERRGMDAWNADQLRGLLDHSPEETPEVSPEPTPLHSPCISASASHQDLQSLEEMQPRVDDDVTGSHHSPSYSWHRDCSACVASAIASSAVSAAYTHNHPPREVEHPTPTAVAQQFRTPPPVAAPSRLQVPPGAFAHPLAGSMSRRMEWSPSQQAPLHSSGGLRPPPFSHTSGAPGTPLRLGSSSLSFVSPASLRLTHIKIQKLKQAEEQLERIRTSLNDSMQQHAYEEQQQQQQQVEEEKQWAQARDITKSEEGQEQATEDTTDSVPPTDSTPELEPPRVYSRVNTSRRFLPSFLFPSE